MSDKNQTAVEWLVEQMQTFEFTHLDRSRILQQALEMEKQQLIDFYEDGCIESYGLDSPLLHKKDREFGEDLYNQTFNL